MHEPRRPSDRIHQLYMRYDSDPLFAQLVDDLKLALWDAAVKTSIAQKAFTLAMFDNEWEIYRAANGKDADGLQGKMQGDDATSCGGCDISPDDCDEDGCA